VGGKGKRLRDDPSRVIVLGGGRGGLAMLEMLHDEALATVVGMVDVDANALGMVKARELGVETFYDVESALVACAPCVAFNLTGNEMVEEVAADILGAGGVIGGLEARLLWRMVTDLKKAKVDLEFLASHDPLTGLYNRRYITEQLEREVSLAMRYGMDCALAILDLDYFKRVNDEHGHVSGDVVLKFVADTLQQSVRTSDVLGRWGGEEFLVLLPHTSEKNAVQAVQTWLDKLTSQTVKLTDGERVQVSFSAGVASFLASVESEESQDMNKAVDALLELVDNRLYKAKEQGRSCVVGGTKKPDSMDSEEK